MTHIMSPEFVAPAFWPEAEPLLVDPTHQPPEDLLGFNIKAMQDCGGLAVRAGLLPQTVGLKLDKLDQAAELIDLFVAIKAGEPVTYEDMQENIVPLTELNPKIGVANKLAKSEFLRTWIMKKLNERALKQTDKMLETAREKIDKITKLEANVEHIASFENPREQFTTEVNRLAETVREAIIEQRDVRVQCGVTKEDQPPVPKGLKGMCVRVYRKIKSFFGFLKSGGRPKVNSDITSYDVGAGIEKVYTRLASDNKYASQSLPLLSKFLDGRLSKYVSHATKDNLAFAAPELLRFFSSLSPSQEKWQSMIESANRNTHEFRFLTKFVHHYKGFSLSGIEEATTKLLPALREVLPTQGKVVRQAFEQLKQLLEPRQKSVHINQATETEKKPIREHISNTYAKLQAVHPAAPKVAAKIRGAFAEIQHSIKQRLAAEAASEDSENEQLDRQHPKTKRFGRLKRLMSRKK